MIINVLVKDERVIVGRRNKFYKFVDDTVVYWTDDFKNRRHLWLWNENEC